MIRKYFLYIGIVCVLILSAFLNQARHSIAYENIKKAALGKLTLAQEIIVQPQMPPIEIAGPKGELVSLPEKGQYMLINLWSAKYSDSLFNLNTMRHLQTILHGYGENWKIIGVSIDNPKDIELVSRTIKKYNISEIAGYYDARGDLLKFIDPKAFPATIIVNDKGHVLYKIYGNAPWLDPDVIAFLRTLPRAMKE